jgi:hypothetical protein
MANGQKKCSLCKEMLPLDLFSQYRRKDRDPDKLYWCSSCNPCRRLRWNSKLARRQQLARRYNVTPEWFDETLAKQGGCAACGSETTDGKYWHIDHDHSCCAKNSCGKCIRGILCHGCNTGLGNVGDSIERLNNLIDYLTRTAVLTNA